MDAKLLVILVLGLAIVGLAGYYLLVVVPQQEAFYFQLQQQAEQQQIQQAIAYCASVNQQYNFSTGGCEPLPIQVQASNWISGATGSVQEWLQANLGGVYTSLDNTFNPFNPDSLVAQSFSNFVDFVNPLNPESFWANLGNIFFGGS